MTRTTPVFLLLSILILGGCAQTVKHSPAPTVNITNAELPTNVNRWLNQSLSNQPSMSNEGNKATLIQQGEIYVKDKWLPFTSEATYSNNLDYFLWEASIKIAFGVWVSAEDGHNTFEGWGGAKMWGAIPLGGMRGEKIHLMQASRSLAEIAWNPQLVKTSPNISWKDTGQNSFSATKHIGENSVTVNFELNDANQIVRAAGLRYIDIEGELTEMRWGYKFSDHAQLDEVNIPLKGVATYYKPSGPWEYFRVEITSN